MIESLIQIVLFSVFFAEISQVPQNIMHFLCQAGLVYKLDAYNSHKPRRIKPFDCAMCLSLWIGIVYSIVNYNGLFHLLSFCAMCSIGAIVVIRILHKLQA